jgi:HEAT repeat protein
MHQARCPHCGSLLDDDGSLAGQEVVCPSCTGIFCVGERAAPGSGPSHRAARPAGGLAPASDAAETGPVSEQPLAKQPPRATAGPEPPPVYGPDPLPKIDTEAAPRPASAQTGQRQKPRDPRTVIYSLLGLALFLAALIGAVVGGRYVRQRRVADAEASKTVGQWIDQLARGRDKAARHEAAEALLAEGPQAMMQALDATTDAPDEGNSISITPPAVQAIADLGPPVVGTLAEALGSETLDVRVAAAYILREMGPESKGAVTALAKAAGDRNARVRWYAIDALANAGEDAAPAVPALIPLLENKDRFTRRRAVVTLGRIGPPAKAAVPALAKLQSEVPDRSIRQAAEAALHLINLDRIAAESMSRASDEVKELVRRLGEEDQYESVSAARALGRLGPKAVDAVPALAQALGSKNKWVREAAAEALGEMGRDARPYVPVLEKAAGDEEEVVRQAAQQALEKIRPGRS